MNDIPRTEREAWIKVREQFNTRDLVLGRNWSERIHRDPRHLVFVLSWYKFAARMACKGRRILELGCNEGIGVPILTEFSESYLGIDMHAPAMEVSRQNWSGEKIEFITDNFLEKKYGEFDSVISFDVRRQINPGDEFRLLQTICLNLGSDGVCLLGAPDVKRWVNSLRKFFYNIFIFSMNDEVIQAGLLPTADYFLVMACYKKEKKIR